MPKLALGYAPWIVLYLACVIAVVAGLTRGRKRAIAVYGTETAQSDWDDWRTAAGERPHDSGPTGPVQRRAPGSKIPPALALMKDHFGSCLVFSLIMTTALFTTTMFLIRGIFSRRQSE